MAKRRPVRSAVPPEAARSGKIETKTRATSEVTVTSSDPLAGRDKTARPAASTNSSSSCCVPDTGRPVDPAFTVMALVGGAECGGSTPYERLTLQLHHDRRWRQEVSLGKRVGLYRMRGDLGAGNFSNVKMAVHQLTSGKQATAKATACRLIPKSALLYLPYSSVLVALVGQHPSSLLCLRAPGG
ncbi:uncharacterized protein LOC127748808 isoform X1 [Frankliniella occidentalis]|uniref:Uncharacterized protein LOC127748808 isoform X1 n=1 Tax=Frankliniella occidentalis TaxID=133901 RepID=A0A9C6TNC9_FRAOC|nr:uncharacterized protein LOC127748808 isoform X1 [Frankliniella occidentalis]